MSACGVVSRSLLEDMVHQTSLYHELYSVSSDQLKASFELFETHEDGLHVFDSVLFDRVEQEAVFEVEQGLESLELVVGNFKHQLF